MSNESNEVQVHGADQEGKLLALVSHLGPLTGIGTIVAPLLVFLLKKDNEFAARHAKQALVYQLVCIVAGGVIVKSGVSA